MFKLSPAVAAILNFISEQKTYRCVLYKFYVFCSGMKFKMAATAGLSLTLDPMRKNVSKRFFSETTWIIETKLPRNDHWKVLYKVCVFYADRKSKMAATAGHRLTLDPMGNCSNAFFSETTNMIKAKLYMNVHWMVLYKHRNKKRTVCRGPSNEHSCTAWL